MGNTFLQSDSLSDHYFYLLLLEELDGFITSGDIARNYEDLYHDIIINNVDILSKNFNTADIYYYLYILKYFDFDISDDIEQMCLELLKERYEEFAHERELYYYVLCQILLNDKIDTKWVDEKIRTHYIDSSGFSISNDVELVNMISTYRMLKLITMLNIPSREYLDISLNSYYGIYGGYRMQYQLSENNLNIYNENFTLESWYCGVYCQHYLSKAIDGDKE